MSFATSAALQTAIFRRLENDSRVGTALSGHLYDAVPEGPLPGLYATLGEERVRAASDATGRGAWHDLALSVVTEAAGFLSAKEAAVAICDALDQADLSLSRGRLVSLRFVKARAARAAGGFRRIDMTFRARTESA